MKMVMIALVGINMFLGAAVQAQTYPGSSFNEVWDVIENKNFIPKTDLEKKEFNIYQQGKLPQYPFNAQSIFSHGDTELKRDAKRTVNERFDYYDRLAKKLHPNGVCVAGEWNINRQTPYTGYFASLSRGLFIGRISVAMEDTTSEDDRGFGFAGKIFPTLNPNQIETTGNFFTVDVLLGTNLKHVLNARTTNQPETGFKLGLLSLGLKIAAALKTADENPSFRPLTQVANLDIDPNKAMKQPKWIRITADSKLKRNNQSDFRNEILTAINENHGLKYIIEVSDLTSDRNATTGWTTIGEINLSQALVSYGCDRRLHFAHPKLK
ncbi:MAG: hypothetical protein PHY93_21400 [Bacteriovorax sp.]|nr:hypothetical protein [Bacteriovorax sp.]